MNCMTDVLIDCQRSDTLVALTTQGRDITTGYVTDVTLDLVRVRHDDGLTSWVRIRSIDVVTVVALAP